MSRSSRSRHESSHHELRPAESTREYIDERVSAGNYRDTNDYIRDLLRRDQDEQARKRLRDLIEEELASGPGRPRKKADDKELAAIARGEIN